MDKLEDLTKVVPTTPSPDSAETTPAWAMIEPGRYQPRRIRGSCLGRELG